MRNSNLNTAILFFSRTKSSEIQHKRVLKGQGLSLNATLCDELSKNVRKELQCVGLPVFWIDEELQRGASFGEKFKNAFHDIYAKGYDQIIAVGGDIVGLSKDLLLQAKANLSSAQAVLGPSFDGGDYLIALHKNTFSKLDFVGLNWQTSELHKDLETAISTLGVSLQLLETLHDVDDAKDFYEVLAKGLLSKAFVKVYLSKINIRKTQYTFLFYTHIYTGSIDGLRAPPLAA